MQDEINPKWEIYTQVAEAPSTHGYCAWINKHKIAYIKSQLPGLTDHEAWLTPIHNQAEFLEWIRQAEGI